MKTIGNPDEEGKYRHVQGLVRGLRVLRELNRCRAGTSTAAELSLRTGLHRTSVKRLLETLRHAGFVQALEDGRTYSLAGDVRQLSDGFTGEADVCSKARPLLCALTEKVLWPSALVTLDGLRMVIRYSTHGRSPLSFHSGAVGYHLPLLTTAAGRAYLAFCSDEERELLLDMLRAKAGERGKAADEKGLRRSLDLARRCGYAVNNGDWKAVGDFGAMAVPVRDRMRVIACVNVVFSRKAISIDQAIRRYSDELLETARGIEQRSALRPGCGSAGLSFEEHSAVY